MMKIWENIMFKQQSGLLAVLLCAVSFGLTSLPAQAHHSFAMYDTSVTETFTGKLLRFIPGANHAQILFEVIDESGEYVLADDGKILVWGIEMGGSALIARQGVTVKDFPIGTVLTVTVNPLRNGKTFGVQAGAVISCGDALPVDGCNAETGESFLERRGF